MDSIYTGNGVSELINLCMQALLDNGDEILGARCDFAFDVLNVGIPLRLFVANVVNGIASSKGCASCPKRFEGAWDRKYCRDVCIRREYIL